MPPPFVFTRRDFLKTTAIAAVGMTLPEFLARGAHASPADKDAPILVVIQLGGGNDGLSTVVPFADDAYHRARPRLRLNAADLVRINDHTGLHPNLAPVARLLDSGNAAIVQGVGYPNPDRSHFRSMEIWQTATDSDKYARHGWIGRYFDHQCAGRPDPLAGVAVTAERPQSFEGSLGLGVSFQQPEQFRWVEGGSHADETALRRVNGLEAPKPPDPASTLDFLRHTAANALVGSERVREAGARRRSAVSYPGSQLARSLQTIATLIAGGLPTRIYYASMTGFDTHANQQNPHGRLLGVFADAVAAFQEDLRRTGVSGRVVTMAFSEFGRRVAENASGGTDHGTAGPLFLFGDRIRAGLHGAAPSLEDLDDGDLRHTVDFRAIYSELLGKWMQADARQVLGARYDPVGVLG
jgi:uncharacterized protein (DUF1501 family)